MPLSSPVAVIDIGSNSVRLVIFDGLKRAPLPLYNEKVLCGLAKHIETTGKLHAQGIEQAYVAIARFIALAQVRQCTAIHLFATAAVRDAKDGAVFVREIKNRYKQEVLIFSGEEEAKYAGLGIVASVARPKGVVGDLGGGSFELIPVENKEVGKGVSFPIGPLRLPDLLPSRTELEVFVDEHIGDFPLASVLKDKDFYAVGGAFRNLAKLHMHRKNYPLKVIHNYKVPADDLLATLQVVARMSSESLQRLPSIISRKRLDFMPYAATVLARVIMQGDPRQIVFCASGVREGFLYSLLDDKTKRKDALIAGCEETMRRIVHTPEYGYELEKWVEPLFPSDSSHDKKLRLAACILSEISCYENTEYRAEMAYRRVLDSSLVGLSHRDRVFIAKALYCRYSQYPDEHILSTMQPLLTEKKIHQAQVLGSAMRLARSLCSSTTGILPATRLRVEDHTLTLHLGKEYQALVGEAVHKRARQLADTMGMEYKIV